MRFKLDENLSRAAGRVLVEAGYDVSTVHVRRIGGTNDEHLAAICRDEARILVTLDLDFADVVAYPPDQYAGFIVIRAHISRIDPSGRHRSQFASGLANRESRGAIVGRR